MREILVRGKRLDNGEWVEGTMYQVAKELNPFIMLTNRHAESHEVDPATVGQYTGLENKNGKRIFEGDIVALPALYGGGKGVVTYCGAAFRAFNEVHGYQVSESMEVIGNIHDNPELMDGGTE